MLALDALQFMLYSMNRIVIVVSCLTVYPESNDVESDFVLDSILF